MVGILTVAYGVPLPEATAIALVDRAISVFSIIVFGSILYVVSPKPRGKGLHEPVEPARHRRRCGRLTHGRPRSARAAPDVDGDVPSPEGGSRLTPAPCTTAPDLPAARRVWSAPRGTNG